MNKNAHVYCTNCKYGKLLIEAIMSQTDMPDKCKDCYPYDVEDSKKFDLRKNYVSCLSPYKFRGLRSDDVWVYGDLLANNGATIVECGCVYHEVYPCSVGQYIGRKDTKEKDVYSGDIVLVETYDAPNFKGIVDFQDCSFVIKNDFITAYRWMDYKVTILGNVCENPELLEAKNEIKT